jgi:hypothetical protein
MSGDYQPGDRTVALESKLGLVVVTIQDVRPVDANEARAYRSIGLTPPDRTYGVITDHMDLLTRLRPDELRPKSALEKLLAEPTRPVGLTVTGKAAAGPTDPA